MKQTIVFTANKTTVTANKYVPYALYKQNKAIIESLGGHIDKGNEGFVAKFPSNAKAKEFVSNAVCGMTKSEYNATRKSEPKVEAKKAKPTKGKGKTNTITLTDADGNTYEVPMSALGITPKKTTTKKAVAATPKKAVTESKKAVTKGKGKSKSAVDFSKLAGKGRTANKKAAKLIYDAGYKPNTDEFNALWEEWCNVR